MNEIEKQNNFSELNAIIWIALVLFILGRTFQFVSWILREETGNV